jgi:hypothetical protein
MGRDIIHDNTDDEISHFTVEEVTRTVKRWRPEDQVLRWTAVGLREAERKFRRVKGYRELETLHRRLNPQCSCRAAPRIGCHEVLIARQHQDFASLDCEAQCLVPPSIRVDGPHDQPRLKRDLAKG